MWDALSAVVEISGNGLPTLRQNRRKRPNKAIAKKLRMKFLSWFRCKKVKDGYFNPPISNLGFREIFFQMLEEFLGMNLVIYLEKRILRKKVGYSSLLKTDKITRCLFMRYSSTHEKKTTLYMASSEDSGHIRLIKDVMAFSNKYICMCCQKSYGEKRYLESHSCKKINFRCEALYKWRQSLIRLAQFEFNLKKEIQVDLKFCHILVNKQASTKNVEIELHFALMGSDHLILKRLYANLETAAKFIVDICGKAATYVLSERMRLNFEWVKQLETQLNAMANSGLIQFDPIRSQRLKDMKTKLVQYLSEYTTYIQCGTKDFALCQDLMHALLSVVCQDYSAEKITVKFCKSTLQMIKIIGYPVKFLCLNAFGSTFKKSIAECADVQTFRSIVKRYWEELNLNIVGIESDALIGFELVSNCLNEAQCRSFFTPSKDFYNFTHNVNVKFGLICAQPQLIHKDSQIKSILSCDFERFYFRILTMRHPLWLCKGIGIPYTKNDSNVFVPKRNRRRKSIANLFLILLEHVLQIETISLLNGREAKIGNFSVDAYFQYDGKTYVLEFNGCASHSHNLLCHFQSTHIDKIDPSHRLNCMVCKTNEHRNENFLRPTLWRLRGNETRNSPHFHQKDLSYDEVFSKTEEKQKVLRNNGFNLITIWECLILKFWSLTVGQFFDELKLSIGNRFRNEIFSDLFQKLAMKHFPLLAYTTLTETKIVDAIRCGKLTGFAQVTASLGPISRANLQIICPFFFKDDQDKAVQSCEVTKKVVPTVLLQGLLSNNYLEDFRIKEVHEIIEFRHNVSINPFHKLRQPILECLQKFKGSDFSKHLKASLNSCIGLFSFNAAKHKKSILATQNDIMTLNNLTRFSHATTVDTENLLLHFQSKSSISNISTLHLSLIGYGVRLVMEFILGLKHYCKDLNAARINCDGASFTSSFAHPTSILSCKTITSVCLDTFLRPDLDLSLAKEYFKWKKRFFPSIGICDLHATSYVHHLATKREPFFQHDCCLTATATNIDFPMKFENLSDVGIIRSVNQCCFYNTKTGETMMKSGGKLDSRFNDIATMSLNDLENML